MFTPVERTEGLRHLIGCSDSPGANETWRFSVICRKEPRAAWRVVAFERTEVRSERVRKRVIHKVERVKLIIQSGTEEENHKTTKNDRTTINPTIVMSNK